MTCPNGPSPDRAATARSKSALLTSAAAANAVPSADVAGRCIPSISASSEMGAAAPGVSDAHRRASCDWRLVGLLEISNFASLRRLLGIARADQLTIDIAKTIVAHYPAARCATIGRATLELSVDLTSRAQGEELLTVLQALFAVPVPVDGELLRIELVFGAAVCPIAAFDEIKLAEETER